MSKQMSDDFEGQARTAKELIALGRHEEALATIESALDKAPKQLTILSVAGDAHRAMGNIEKSLEYAERIVEHNPENWIGYGRAAKDLITLGRFGEADKIVESGLKLASNKPLLLRNASNAYRASGNHEKSLEYALRLIALQPDLWDGYKSAARNLIDLRRFDQLLEFCGTLPEKFQEDEEALDWANTAREAKQAISDLEEYETLKIVKSFVSGRDLAVPFGDLCIAAQFVKDSKARSFAMPFDWLFITPTNIKDILETDFADFLDPQYLQSQYPKRQCGHTKYRMKNFFNHHDPSREPDRSAFTRQVERFQDMIAKKVGSLFFFNVRLQDRSDDLRDLVNIMSPDAKILSFVFLPGDRHEIPKINIIEDRLIQITFTCDRENTLFARTTHNRTGFTDGLHIQCPYSRTYASILLEEALGAD